MIQYYKKGSDIIAIAEGWSSNFSPEANTEIAEQYRLWLSEGNEAEEWNPQTEGPE